VIELSSQVHLCVIFKFLERSLHLFKFDLHMHECTAGYIALHLSGFVPQMQLWTVDLHLSVFISQLHL
jgi:hypothetical protein